MKEIGITGGTVIGSGGGGYHGCAGMDAHTVGIMEPMVMKAAYGHSGYEPPLVKAKPIEVNEWERRVRQIGKNKRHYFMIGGWWHFIQLDERLPPLIGFRVKK